MFVLLIIVYFLKVCYSYQGPNIQTPLGSIRGLLKTSVEGNVYSCFEGIPYAKPPVGDLKFEEPVPIEPWQGIWDATKAYQCLQDGLVGPMGSEDCLYLNIYVPGKNVEQHKKRDVVVLIHGGAFMMGSGDMMLNSAFVMDQDHAIFISINYRLGLLGFLSTEDDEIPGNNGMKDQVLALKWVKDNIEYFGGNPNSITISGMSAGAASVHLHYLSPLSEGLFQRGLSHSGTALNPWVIKENPLVFAKNLSVSVGCPDSSTKELKECIKSRPSNLLLEKSSIFTEYQKMPFSPFAVVIDGYSKNPFLPENPYQMLLKKKVADLPWVASMTRDEGIFPGAWYCDSWDEIDKNFIQKAHILLDYNHTLPEEVRENFATKIKDYYLGKEESLNDENSNKFYDLLTHRFFGIGIEDAVKLQSKANKSPVYYYYFNFDEEKSQIASFLCPHKEIKGVGHCDDIFYIYGFQISNANPVKKLKSVFDKIIKYFVSGQYHLLKDNFNWLPSEGEYLTYLNITSDTDLNVQKINTMVPEGIWDDLNIIEYDIKDVKDEL